MLRTTGAASKASRHFADVDPPVLDYKAKGYTAQLVGTETIGGRPAWDVRITMPDGYESENFIDQKSYLLIGNGHTAKVHAFGNEVTSRTRFSDFRPVAGVLFPFRSSEIDVATGKELNAMQWGSITANRDIPVSWFSPPVFERTPAQTFIEQLYGQREDPSAVMWTYRIFRRAHPGEDTSDAAETAGYQILKMDEVPARSLCSSRSEGLSQPGRRGVRPRPGLCDRGPKGGGAGAVPASAGDRSQAPARGGALKDLVAPAAQ